MSDNMIQFPDSSGRCQLQIIYDDALDNLKRMLEGNEQAAAQLARADQAAKAMIINLRATTEGLSAMMLLSKRRLNSAVEELNQIEQDLMNRTSNHPLVQGMIDDMQEKAQTKAMADVTAQIANNLEIEDFDAEIFIQILSDNHPRLYLDHQGKQWLVELMRHIGQQGKATA